jgi:hypothetical protein
VAVGTPTRVCCTGLINAFQVVLKQQQEDTRGKSSPLYSVGSLEKLGLFVLFTIISNVNLLFARHADLPKGIYDMRFNKPSKI